MVIACHCNLDNLDNFHVKVHQIQYHNVGLFKTKLIYVMLIYVILELYSTCIQQVKGSVIKNLICGMLR